MDRSIPFLDLVTPHARLGDELIDVVHKTVRSEGFLAGEMVETFEREFALLCGVRHCIGVSSGEDALLLALRASGVAPGDVVITVPNAPVETGKAIIRSGAFPDFVDVNNRTWLMDVKKLEEYLATRCEHDEQMATLFHRKTGRPVRAVVPVHLYGLMADMDPVLDLASRYGLILIEDAGEAHGARYYSKKTGQWQTAGSLGHAAAFSFSPGRDAGACGDAGAVTTDSAEIASKVRLLRDHERAYGHAVEGCSGRLDAIRAGCLTIELKYLVHWIACRRRIASRYKELLKNIDLLASQCEPMDSISACRHYVVRTSHRDRLKDFLFSKGIDTGLHYPAPLHRQSCMAPYGFTQAAYPEAERLAVQALSLPLFPGLGRDQVHTICRHIRDFSRTPDLVMTPRGHNPTI